MPKIGRDFYYLIIGQGFSRLGNNFFTLALLWFVLEETGSSIYVGLTAILLTIPNILSMFTGVIVDRINRWKIMISVELIQIILTLTLAVVGWKFDVHLVVLIITTILIQTAGAFFGPAENSVIPLLVGKKEHLTMANSINQLVTMVSKIVGLAVGGILMGLFGAYTLVFINGITFVISLMAILAIRPFAKPNLNSIDQDNSEGEKSFLVEWKIGFQTVLKKSTLRKIIPIAILVNFSLAPLMSLNPVWVKDVLKLDSAAYGFVEAAMFIGVIVGVILVNIVHKFIPYHRLIPLSLLIMACSVIFLAIFPSLYITMSCMILFGIAAGIINTGVFTLMQWVTPNEFLGRVSGILIGATNISLPFGMAIGSILSSTTSLSIIFIGGGALALCGVIFALGLPNLSQETNNSEDIERSLVKEGI